MGLFDKTTKNVANAIYEQSKKHIAEKDGLVHTIAYKHSKAASVSTGAIIQCAYEEPLTMQLNEIVAGLQKDGYEIVDIKFCENQKEYTSIILYR